MSVNNPSTPRSRLVQRCYIVSGGRIVTYGFAGVFFSVLDFLSCA